MVASSATWVACRQFAVASSSGATRGYNECLQGSASSADLRRALPSGVAPPWENCRLPDARCDAHVTCQGADVENGPGLRPQR
jgi:hypothetical protein